MRETTPTLNVARGVRVLHFALVMGVVLAGGVFAFLVQFKRFPPSAPQVVATILAALSIVIVTFAVAFLRRRVPERRADESPTSYWSSPQHRGSAIVLWAVTEGAALLGLVGYLLTGALAPALSAGLAIVTLAVFRPSYLEGAA